MAGMSNAEAETTNSPLDQGLRWTGIAVQVVIAAFPLAASGLMAPPWALAVVAVMWVAGLVVAWRIGVDRPRFTLVVPAVTLLVWYAFMTIGDLWLGWVA